MPLVATTGSNVFGQLGRETMEHRSDSFSIVSLDADVSHVCCGHFHTVVLTSTQKLIGWGRNAEGQLGFPTHITVVTEPKALLSPEWCVSKVCCGEGYTMFLSLDGDVFVFGSGACGQLGQGTLTTSSPVPLKVQVGEPMCDIAAGARTCFAIATSGAVYAWGESASGMLGSLQVAVPYVLLPMKLSIGPQKTRLTNVIASESFAIFITASQDVVASGNNCHGQLVGIDAISSSVWKPLKIPRVRDLSCGNTHVVALLGNGRVIHTGAAILSCGSGSAVQVLPVDRCVGVAAGRGRSFFLLSDGSLLGVGKNKDGELGVGCYLDVKAVTHVVLPPGCHAIAASCGSRHSAVLLSHSDFEDESLMKLVPMEDDNGSSDELMSFGRWDEDISNVSFSRAPQFRANTLSQSSDSQVAAMCCGGHGSAYQSGSLKDDPYEHKHDAFRITKTVFCTSAVALLMGTIGLWLGRRWGTLR